MGRIVVAELGLAGMVEPDDLRGLVDGHHPGTGVDLLAGRPQRRVNAFDATFSAPKSVSLLWALGSPHISSALARAHTEAVSTALEFLESKAAAARRQEHGVRRRVTTGGFAIATFVHRTSREGDPQLHSHCLIANVVRRQDGTHVAFAGHGLFEWAKAAGSIYQASLQRLLSMRLGLAWGPLADPGRATGNCFHRGRPFGTRTRSRPVSRRGRQREANGAPGRDRV